MYSGYSSNIFIASGFADRLGLLILLSLFSLSLTPSFFLINSIALGFVFPDNVTQSILGLSGTFANIASNIVKASSLVLPENFFQSILGLFGFILISSINSLIASWFELPDIKPKFMLAGLPCNMWLTATWFELPAK